MRRKLSWQPLLLAVALIVVAVPAVAAATIATEDEDYVLAQGETVEGNLYVAASKVTVEGTVTGDLVATGETVTIGLGGVVEGDVIAAGQEVRVEGTVEGDYRAAGFSVVLDDNAAVRGDMTAMGFSVGAGDGSLIGGDVLSAGYQGYFDGDIVGDLHFGGVGLEIGGSVAGSVKADVASDTESSDWMDFVPFPATLDRTVNPGLDVGPDAEVGGDLEVTSPEEPDVREAAIAGSVDYEKTEVDEDGEPEEERNAALDWLIGTVKDYVSLLIVGLLLLWIWPGTMSTAATVISRRPLPSFGWGLVTVAVAVVLAIAIPIIAIMLAVFLGIIGLEPLIGPVLAGAGLLWSIATFGTYLLGWAARIVVAVWIASAILGRGAPNLSENRVALLMLGLLVFVPVTNIPCIGVLVEIVLVLLGIGALEAHTWLSWLSYRDSEPAPLAEF
ncbi:MAG: polymer-forming cytoskeletal protein [Anaerolineae bacterium]